MSTITDIMLSEGVDEKKAMQFDKYYRLLREWNEKINLTAIIEEEDVAQKHFVDCISPLKKGKLLPNSSVIDVGTGAGFPGLVLKIFEPSLKLTLVDSLNKRVNFLNAVIKELDLCDVTTIHSRAEELGKNKEHREKYDYCVSRAVANLATLCELCLPLVKPGGEFISLKGPKAEEELSEAKKAIGILGGEFDEIINYGICETDYDHNLVIIKKKSPTPPAYPRNAPKPSKEPIK